MCFVFCFLFSHFTPCLLCDWWSSEWLTDNCIPNAVSVMDGVNKPKEVFWIASKVLHFNKIYLDVLGKSWNVTKTREMKCGKSWSIGNHIWSTWVGRLQNNENSLKENISDCKSAVLPSLWDCCSWKFKEANRKRIAFDLSLEKCAQTHHNFLCLFFKSFPLSLNISQEFE